MKLKTGLNRFILRAKHFSYFPLVMEKHGFSNLLLFLLISCLSFSCDSGTNKQASPEAYFKGNKIESGTKYANLFDVYKTDGIRKIVVHSPFNDTAAAAVYYLVDSNKYKRFKSLSNVLPFPLHNIAVLSSTQLDAVNRLGLLSVVKGVSDQKYIQNKRVLQALKSGKIVEISANGQLFVEKTIRLNPQVVFFSPFQRNQTLPVKGGIKAIPFFDFMESGPLGRAEWIKFTAAFIGREKEADSIFNSIEKQYQELKLVAQSAQSRPAVFSGKYFNGQWFVPGGKSYMAQIFSDAGAGYIWKSDSSRNSIALDFEVVLQKAQNADYWRILGGLPNDKPYEKLLQENRLYGHFKAFKEHHIIYCNPVLTAYFEKGTLEPQVVLKDFISAFHPELFPEYEPVYYRVLP